MTYSRLQQAMKSACIVLVVSTLSGCFLVSAGMHDEPGYADMHYPSIFRAKSTQKIALGPTIFKPLRWAAKESGSEEAELFQHMDGLRVRSYTLEQNPEHIAERMTESIARIQAQGWETSLKIEDEKDRAVILTKEEAGQIYGVAIFIMDEHEAAFINIIGHVDPSHIRSLVEGQTTEQTLAAIEP